MKKNIILLLTITSLTSQLNAAEGGAAAGGAAQAAAAQPVQDQMFFRLNPTQKEMVSWTIRNLGPHGRIPFFDFLINKIQIDAAVADRLERIRLNLPGATQEERDRTTLDFLQPRYDRWLARQQLR